MSRETLLDSLSPGQTYRGVEGIRQLSSPVLESREDCRFETEQIVDWASTCSCSPTPRDAALGVKCRSACHPLRLQGRERRLGEVVLSEREALEAVRQRE